MARLFQSQGGVHDCCPGGHDIVNDQPPRSGRFSLRRVDREGIRHVHPSVFFTESGLLLSRFVSVEDMTHLPSEVKPLFDAFGQLCTLIETAGLQAFSGAG